MYSYESLIFVILFGITLIWHYRTKYLRNKYYDEFKSN